jgi:hypothetical protein
MKETNFYELTIVAIIFCLIFIIVFVGQIILIVRFRNGHNNRLDEIDTRIKENEKLVKSQISVNDEVIKMINSVNKLIGKK